ncbi:MAG: alpha-L-rhamnosidase, partial [Eubacteriales bacterium]
MLKNAVCITDSRFANTAPLPVFHRENEPFDNRHPAEYENRHILFRRAFSLDSLPGQAVLSISADDYYKLYVNGTYVTQGPAPGYPFHYYYNDIDIQPYLRTGRNVIAVHTYYQGLYNRVWVS